MNKLIILWSNHDEILLVAGICPLLVVVTNMTLGFSIGLIFLITLVSTATAIALLKNLIPLELRFPFIIIVSSTIICLLGLVIQFRFYPLGEALGIFMPLIAVNCLILAFAEEISLRQTVFNSFIQSVRIGATILLIFIIIGLLREIFGFGTILQQVDLLFGESAQTWTLQVFDDFSLILIKQPAGVFLVLGLLMAGINCLMTRFEPPESS